MGSMQEMLSKCFPSTKSQEDSERDEQMYKSYENIVSQLPFVHYQLIVRNYKSCWIPDFLLLGSMAIPSHFKPHPSDILLVTNPKSGTTWLKALSYATLHRHSFSLSDDDHPLLTTNPHGCVLFLEFLFSHRRTIPDLSALPSPTIFATHLPFSLLPESALNCPIVYLCRDPKDTFVSLWSFLETLRISMSSEEKSTEDSLDLSKAFQMFCQGKSSYGPFWDHMLGYWKESLRRPDKVLFLRYEEMMENPVSHLRRLAEFMGCPFSMEEERDGLVEDIVKFCSFDKLSKLEVNKNQDCSFAGKIVKPPTSSYFRKGRVGDWVNYLSMEMAEKLDAITKEKLHGSGLSFESTAAASMKTSS